MSKTLKRDTYSSNLEKKIPSRNRMNWHLFLLPAYFAFFHWFISLCQRYAIKSLILLNQCRIITHLIRYHHNHCYNPTHCHVLVYSLCLFPNHNLSREKPRVTIIRHGISESGPELWSGDQQREMKRVAIHLFPLLNCI